MHEEEDWRRPKNARKVDPKISKKTQECQRRRSKNAKEDPRMPKKTEED